MTDKEEMRKTLNAVRKQLAIFDDLVLYPTYQYELQHYPKSQKSMVELAMKANFFKTSYEIRQKTEEHMKERWSKRVSNK
ncbi:hypothetical protein SUGI_0064600 [Cryptomeria japonica]|nr:hypothetical protein SUGI_0064600 [Cryptomeria japonica]